MTTTHRFIALIIIANLCAVSCARIISPTGGPEDEKGPELISSNPKAGETGYSGNTLIFSFDERVQARSLETDLVITPKPKGSFRSKITKNTVTLTFFEPFEDSTTYSINFANSIQDVTNNNPAIGIGISFSTGPYIDSLSIAGNVKNLYNQEPVENALVSLYQLQDSLDIIKGSASYYSKTDSLGNYTFQNLPSGSFRIYSVRDKNNNGIADTDKEQYGFYADTLELSNSLEGIDMTLQNLSTEDLRTVSARSFGTYYDITFNKAIEDFKILSGQELIYHPFSEEKIRFYNTSRTFEDTTQLIYSVKDSLNFTLVDTADFYFVESKLSKTNFTYQFTESSPGILDIDTLSIEFTKPVLTINADSLNFIRDSVNIISLDTSLFQWNEYRTEVKYPVTAETMFSTNSQSAIFDIRSAAFISVDLDSSKGQQKTITKLLAENTATISGTVTSSSNNVLVQLLDSRTLNVIKQSTEKNFTFPYIPAGRYQVRVIKDINGNGKWDIANILTNSVSEPAKFYFDDFYNTKIIEVRKNWEQTDVNVIF
ncbi:Ig-like domain-containing protein [Roseivirga misakiensis]|uniref:SbsA Ig-like domain-containing protein n=1 Tax=Roseivirga misakiensis TaxID=1563681 RepID=A0A1E5T6S0_9BACT|nr:Ig-like domain-containing protein [Roseivirga misakiensis]OEK07084.1 hypothetical protein BFP71_05345 [Roseivirga misakiensis]